MDGAKGIGGKSAGERAELVSLLRALGRAAARANPTHRRRVRGLAEELDALEGRLDAIGAAPPRAGVVLAMLAAYFSELEALDAERRARLRALAPAALGALADALVEEGAQGEATRDDPLAECALALEALGEPGAEEGAEGRDAGALRARIEALVEAEAALAEEAGPAAARGSRLAERVARVSRAVRDVESLALEAERVELGPRLRERAEALSPGLGARLSIAPGASRVEPALVPLVLEGLAWLASRAGGASRGEGFEHAALELHEAACWLRLALVAPPRTAWMSSTALPPLPASLKAASARSFARPAGEGVRVGVAFPLTRRLVEGLLVRAGEHRVLVADEANAGLERVEKGARQRVAGKAELAALRGRALPLVELAASLEAGRACPAPADEAALLALLVRTPLEPLACALLIDEALERTKLVAGARPGEGAGGGLAPALAPLRGGGVALVLDHEELVASLISA